MIFSDSFGGLDAIVGGYYYSKPIEDGRNGYSNSKNLEMTYHMFSCSKNHLEPFLRPHLTSGGLRLEKCPSMVPNYQNTAQMWMIREGMGSIF